MSGSSDRERALSDSRGESSRSSRKSQSSRSSSTDDQLTSPLASSSSETSPTKKSFFKLFTPKKSKKSRTTPDKCTSPKSTSRPILSSQCTDKPCEIDASPIKLPVVGLVPLLRPLSPTGDSRFDFGSLDDEKVIPTFLGTRTCYHAMPISGKVIVLSTELLVKNAFSCLVTNEIRAAPLWESSTQTFVGMLTISDFINVLRHYYYYSREDIKSIENQKIINWREITNVTKPIVQILPNDSLMNAARLLLQERIHRLPVYDEKRNSVLFVITRKRLLQYLYKNLLEKMSQAYNMKAPSYMQTAIGDMRSQIGTWENIATVSVNTTVIEALNLFCERNVSSLPVMDAENKLVDIFAKFDVFALAKEQTYDNLEMTVSEALQKAEVHECWYGCGVEESFESVIDRFVSVKAHRLVVVDDKRSIIGILSLSDILKFLTRQPLEESRIASDIIDEAPEGAIGGLEDSSVFMDSSIKPSRHLQQSSSLEKQDSSDLSEDFVKLQLETDTEPFSEASVSED